MKNVKEYYFDFDKQEVKGDEKKDFNNELVNSNNPLVKTQNQKLITQDNQEIVYDGTPDISEFINDEPQKINNVINNGSIYIAQNNYHNNTNNNEYIEQTNDAQVNSTDNDKRYLLKQFLNKNPFLFEQNSNNSFISSIEDFYIHYKNETYRFGDCLRDQAIPKRKLKRTFNANFKKWKEEINQRLSDIEISEDREMDKKEGKVVRIKFFTFILNSIWLLFIFVLLSESIPFFGKRTSFEYTVYTFLIPVLLGGIILGVISNKSNDVYKKFSKYGRKEYKKKIKSLKKEFNKKFEVTYNYYKKPQKFPKSRIPLSLNKTVIGEHRFVEVENIMKQIQEKNVTFNKSKINQKFLRVWVRIITILSGLFIAINYLVIVIKKLIELIVK